MTLSDSQVTQLLTSAYPSVHPPKELLESLLADLQNAAAGPTPRRRLPRPARPGWRALAACAVIIPCLLLALYITARRLGGRNLEFAGTPSADREYAPLDWNVEASSLVVAGKIEKVQEGVQRQNTTVYDGGVLRISEVLKDAAADPAIKAGATVTVHVLTGANRHSEAFVISAGDEGIWILHRKGTLLTPEMRLELTRRQEIADLIARQSVEQAANKDRVLREWAEREAAAFKIPAYSIQRLEADIQRGPDLTLPPESLRGMMVRDANSTGGWVFIDPRGKVALATHYQASWTGFSRGLAPVATTVTKDSILKDAGYIDPTGKLVVPPIYDGCEPFKDGLAVVYKDNKCGLIDPTGKEILPCVYRLIWTHTADVALVEKDNMKQLVDLTGKVLFSAASKDVAGPLSEGLFQVNVPAGSIASALPVVHAYGGSQWVGFVNTKGQFAVDFGPLYERGIFSESRAFHEGLVAAQQHNRWGYIATDARVAIPPKFLQAQDFSEGLAAATEGTDPHRPQWGYINQRGDFVIPRAFGRAGPFREGLAAVLMTTWIKNPEIPGAVMHAMRWGFVDKQGKVAIAPFFDSANNFENGLAIVDEGTRRGGIDKTGNCVWWTDFAAGK